jgi:hypothetical protein
MADKFQPNVEGLEDRCLMSATSSIPSPLCAPVLADVKGAMNNFSAISAFVQNAQSTIHAYGVSTVSELGVKYPGWKANIQAAVANCEQQANALYKTEVWLENSMVQLEKLEGTTYRSYNHSAFNNYAALFNAYDKAFWTEMTYLEALL